MKRRINEYAILISLTIFLGCIKHEYTEDLINIKIATSFLDCEQDNIHLEIINADSIELIGTIILPICNNDPECETKFYNIKDTTQFYLLEGYLSKMPHNYFDYGCVDSKLFKIVNFERE